MQSNQIEESALARAKRKIRLLIITVTIFGVSFVGLGALWIIAVQKTNGILAPFTDLLNSDQETDMKDEYITGTNGGGVTNTYKTNLKDIVGIMHHLPTLCDQLNKWRALRSFDSVDFRFAVVPQSNADDKGKLTIILVPAVSRKTRYTYSESNRTSWAVDLGDLHP